jgi:branched-chain amino acid transport system permease protein
MDINFFAEVLIGGLLSGVMYALVAIGFVLIYKASGVFNFAQGAMVFFAALTCVGFMDKFGFSLWLAIPATIVAMIILGLAFFIEGLAQLIWGSQVHKLDIPIEDVPSEFLMEKFNIIVSKFDLTAAAICGVMVAVLAVMFAKTKVGRALRAVADDHQAAQAVGIPLQRIWGILWAVAGMVALVAGLLWGARNGVQFALTFIALKALPVLILGGFTSVPGAIVGGLIIGASEKLAEVYIGPHVGGGIEGWFPYVLALMFLLVRPEGLFGEKIIRRI